MKKAITLLLTTLFLVSCKQDINSDDINKINGYWEIEKVILKDGNKKDYKINETIDYFDIRQAQSDAKWMGFRQKVMPQIDGTYKTNNLKEEVFISSENGVFFINYATNYGKWKEEIIKIQDSVLVLKNSEELEYIYKRNKPFSFK